MTRPATFLIYVRQSYHRAADADVSPEQQEAAAEIAPDVARMLTEAINRRLPWEWKPQR